jgi:hypothetical protein
MQVGVLEEKEGMGEPNGSIDKELHSPCSSDTSQKEAKLFQTDMEENISSPILFQLHTVSNSSK